MSALDPGLVAALLRRTRPGCTCSPDVVLVADAIEGWPTVNFAHDDECTVYVASECVPTAAAPF